MQKSILLSGLIFALIVIKLLVPTNLKTVPPDLKDNVLIGQFDNFMRKAFRDNQVEKSRIYNKVEKEAIARILTGYRTFYLKLRFLTLLCRGKGLWHKPHFDTIFWGMHPPTPNFLTFPIEQYNLRH